MGIPVHLIQPELCGGRAITGVFTPESGRAANSRLRKPPGGLTKWEDCKTVVTLTNKAVFSYS